jgi:hypothetical protein
MMNCKGFRGKQSLANRGTSAAVGPGVHSASNRNEYQKQKKIMFLGSKVWPVCTADNLTAICDPIA